MRDRWNPGSMDKSLDKKERNSLKHGWRCDGKFKKQRAKVVS